MADFDIGTTIGVIVISLFVVGFLLSGIKIIRPTHRAAIETLGKYSKFRDSGMTFVIPIFQKMFSVNITDTLIDVEKQDVITKDNLNCMVDAQIYYKVGDTETELKKALYQVNNYERQIVQLAKTTLRNVIGDKDFKTVNSKRSELNDAIYQSISKEVQDWGIEIVRVEVKEITPPEDVQHTMNTVIKAENEKEAAINFANAAETKADGERRAAIKNAEGRKQALILDAQGKQEYQIRVAEGEAKAIELVNNAADKYFIGNAKELKKLQVTENSLIKNTKIVLTKDGISPTLVLNETADKVIPVREGESS